MKPCSVCRTTKPLTEYYERKKGTGRLASACKPCTITRSSRWAKNNPAARAECRKNAERALRQRRKRWLDEKKAFPCADCGGRFPAVCMDFDHLPGTEKVKPVAELLADNRTFEVIEAEIAKCELVCANCHRVRTWERLQYV